MSGEREVNLSELERARRTAMKNVRLFVAATAGVIAVFAIIAAAVGFSEGRGTARTVLVAVAFSIAATLGAAGWRKGSMRMTLSAVALVGLTAGADQLIAGS